MCSSNVAPSQIIVSGREPLNSFLFPIPNTQRKKITQGHVSWSYSIQHHPHDLNDLLASGDTAPSKLVAPVSCTWPPLMLVVLEQNAHM